MYYFSFIFAPNSIGDYYYTQITPRWQDVGIADDIYFGGYAASSQFECNLFNNTPHT